MAINTQKIQRQVTGEVLSGSFDRARYATDASIYQILPKAVLVPKTWADVEAALAFAKEEGIALLPRGGGTSQSGQTVNDALVVDFTKYLNQVQDYDADTGRVVVQPGLVLDDLNRQLKGGRLVVSRGCLNSVARDVGRHGCEQFLRLPFDPLWQDAGQRSEHRSRIGQWRPAPLCRSALGRAA